MKLDCKQLKKHLSRRLKTQRRLPVRIHRLLDKLEPLLYEQKQIDVFDLILRLIACADHEPAEYVMALMAISNDDALTQLGRYTVADIAAFVRDTLKLGALVKP